MQASLADATDGDRMLSWVWLWLKIIYKRSSICLRINVRKVREAVHSEDAQFTVHEFNGVKYVFIESKQVV